MYRASFLHPSRILAPRLHCRPRLHEHVYGEALTRTTRRGRRSNTSIAPGAYSADAEAEDLHRYRPGGYHPIHLGDLLHSRRYRIVHKLGWGGYSTVWLAHDLKTSRLVALKILVAEISRETREVEILRQLGEAATDPQRSLYLSQLQGYFRQDGPNGSHQCLVFDVDGVSVRALAQNYETGRLPGSMAWEVSKQLLLALELLHANGVAHGGQSYSQLL